MKNGFSPWFSYKIISFTCDSTKEINRELVKRGIDATDVINITEDRSHDHWYKVFCKKKL